MARLSCTVTDFSQLVKAYDIRGVYPSEMSEAIAQKTGGLFIRLTGANLVAVAHDMRTSSPALAAAFAEGAASAGADVLDAGLGSTDYAYYIAGSLDIPAAMITASHNPAEYNGIKLCRAGAAPVGEDSGLRQIREWLASGSDSEVAVPGARGKITSKSMISGYVEHLRSLVDLSAIRPLKVVADAGNGMAGYMVPHCQRAVRESGADAGLAFDGDADRCFLIDERGEPVPPSALVGPIAARELARAPGSAVVHNVITSAAAVEIITEHGGRPVLSRVGHSYMKALMAEHDAVFGSQPCACLPHSAGRAGRCPS